MSHIDLDTFLEETVQAFREVQSVDAGTWNLLRSSWNKCARKYSPEFDSTIKQVARNAAWAMFAVCGNLKRIDRYQVEQGNPTWAIDNLPPNNLPFDRFRRHLVSGVSSSFNGITRPTSYHWIAIERIQHFLRAMIDTACAPLIFKDDLDQVFSSKHTKKREETCHRLTKLHEKYKADSARWIRTFFDQHDKALAVEEFSKLLSPRCNGDELPIHWPILSLVLTEDATQSLMAPTNEYIRVIAECINEKKTADVPEQPTAIETATDLYFLIYGTNRKRNHRRAIDKWVKHHGARIEEVAGSNQLRLFCPYEYDKKMIDRRSSDLHSRPKTTR